MSQTQTAIAQTAKLKWLSSDIPDVNRESRPLTSKENQSISQALSMLAKGEREELVCKFLSQTCRALYDSIMHNLVQERGFVLVKGFPTLKDGYEVAQIKKLLLVFCKNLGKPLIQNRQEDLIFDVKSIEGLTIQDENSRGPYVRDSLPMHTDAGAILGMYCLAASDLGGHTILASAESVHDEIKNTRPDLLETLYQPFYTDRRNNEPVDALPYDLNPIFAKHGEVLRCQYHQPFYDGAQEKFPEIPRYTEKQREALNYFDEVALKKHIAIETKVEAGTIIFINNEMILHGRTSFDKPENKTVRYLLRIWLNTPAIPHTFPSFLGYPHPIDE